ncbi:MAG: hypothetical protein IJW51_06490, partial [Clostridia bacterium]|nr:hypothetical protein [Clostridia bacterium]
RCFAVSAEQKGGMTRERGAVICGYDKTLSRSQVAFLPAQTLRIRISSAIAEESRIRKPLGATFLHLLPRRGL